MKTTGAHEQALWIRRFLVNPTARARLVCFPHAGGSASFYFPVATALAPDIEVLAVQYPGRQDRRHEPCIESLCALAREVHSMIPAFDGIPTALFGHSMGATLAFEVARLMEPHRPPAHLFVSGRRAPSVPLEDRRHLLDDDGLIADMMTLGGTDGRIFADEELLRMALPAIRSDYRAVETYLYVDGPRLSCPVTAFTGDADPRASSSEVDKWRDHTSAAFSMSVHPGGHFFITPQRDAVLDILAAKLLSPM